MQCTCYVFRSKVSVKSHDETIWDYCLILIVVHSETFSYYSNFCDPEILLHDPIWAHDHTGSCNSLSCTHVIPPPQAYHSNHNIIPTLKGSVSLYLP